MPAWLMTTTTAPIRAGMCSAFMTHATAKETLHHRDRGDSRPPSQRATASACVRTWSFL